MRLNDAVWGVLLLVLSAAVLIHVQGFPTIPGQKVGPALFPGLIAVALAVCALVLIVKGVAARARGGQRARWFALDEWTRSHRHVVAFFAVVALNVFYIVAVDAFGFIVVGVAYLAVLFATLGVRVRAAVPIAIVSTLVIHFAFYKLLKVPLPWGLLQRFAW